MWFMPCHHFLLRSKLLCVEVYQAPTSPTFSLRKKSRFDIFKKLTSIQPGRGLRYQVVPGYDIRKPSVDAGYGRLFKVYAGEALDKRWLDAADVHLWETNKLTASQREVFYRAMGR